MADAFKNAGDRRVALMTDGERLVWSSTFAIMFDRSDDSIAAAQGAARAVAQLREAARRTSSGSHTLEAEERDFLDEIVNAP